jgi:hypothetical protein
MKKLALIGMAVATALFATSASATVLTRTSLTSGGLIPVAATEIGGIIIDMIGTSGTRVTSQLAASSLYVGFSDDGLPVAFRGNPVTIGIQTGFNAGIVAALGGGIAELAIRITLFDGDSSAGNFDFNDNTLEIDGVSIGNFSSVLTDDTDPTGLISSGTILGFEDNRTNTGWFFSNNAGALIAIFGGLADGELVIGLNDVDPADNFYDFTLGVDGGLINVGAGPTVGGRIPEPGAMALFGLGLAGLGFARRRRKA